jgi:DNA-binding beta-propeller fold protein YncE
MNLYYPKQVSVDPKGYVYVVDTGSGFVDGTVVFAPNGDWLGSQLEPASLAFDINGYIYLADPARNTISKLSPIQ